MITSVFVTQARNRAGEAGGQPGLASLERRIEELTEEVRGLRRDARGEETGSSPGREE